MSTAAIDTLGTQVAEAALRLVAELCPEARSAPEERLEAACAAMRAQVPAAVDELLADAEAAPWMAEIAFRSAVLTLAHAGIQVLVEGRP